MSNKPTVSDLLPVVRTYYAKDGNNCGGHLHIVLEDGNCRDSDVQFCLDECVEHRDIDGVCLCVQLMQLSKTQRMKLSHLNSLQEYQS